MANYVEGENSRLNSMQDKNQIEGTLVYWGEYVVEYPYVSPPIGIHAFARPIDSSVIFR